MRIVMRQFVRRYSRSVAMLCVSAFVVVLSVNCIAQTQMSASDAACCAAMASGCGAAMSRDHQCCRTSSSRLDPQLTAHQRHVLQEPARIAIAVVGAVSVGADIAAGVPPSRASQSSPPPTTASAYLILSVFRV